MKRKNCRWILGASAILWTVILALGIASCGKKTVSPGQRETRSSQEKESQGADDVTEQEMQQRVSAAGEKAEHKDGGKAGSRTGEKAGWQSEDRLIGGGTGPVTYEVKIEERQYTAEDGVPIFKLQMVYPIMTGAESGIPQINAHLEQWAAKKLEEYAEGENSTRQSALEVYRESKDTGWAGPWGERYELESVKAWNGYLSILMDSYLYESGVSGVPYREGLVFRLSDGEKAGLSEITALDAGEWDKVLRARFAKAVTMRAQGDFYEDAAEQIKVRDMRDVGYYFTDSGITFYLPPYEIAPQSTGYVEVTIPFGEIAEYDSPSGS